MMDIKATNGGIACDKFSAQLKQFEDHHGLADCLAASGPFLPMQQQLAFRYILEMDGGSSTWRFKNALLGGFLIFKVDSGNSQFFYTNLEPFEHYIPVDAENFEEDLVKKIQWANEHPTDAKAIADAGARFANEHLRDEDAHWAQQATLGLYASKQHFKVTQDGPSMKRFCCQDATNVQFPTGQKLSWLVNDCVSLDPNCAQKAAMVDLYTDLPKMLTAPSKLTTLAASPQGAAAASSFGAFETPPPEQTAKDMHILVKKLTDPEPLRLDVNLQDSVGDVKALIQESLGIAPKAQQLVFRKKPLQEDEKSLEECCVTDGALLVLLVTEVADDFNTDFTTWDTERSANAEMLSGDGNVLTCPKLARDYISIVTKAPLIQGTHYFQFTMHKIEDEEWCGVTPFPDQAKNNPYPTGLKGWIYYCGRMGYGTYGALQCIGAKGKPKAAKVQPSGDIIGMSIDLDERRIVFDLNGVYQGGDTISADPMWILTTVDRPGDKIEVNELPLSEMPVECRDRLRSGEFPDPEFKPDPPEIKRELT